MVGGLIEKQNVWLVKGQFSEGQSRFLTTAQIFDRTERQLSGQPKSPEVPVQ